MEKCLFMIFAVIGLSIVITASTVSLPPVYSSSAQDADDVQEEPKDDEPEPVDEPDPLEPLTEPLGDADSNVLDDSGFIEREKECPKGEYDNGGKCTKIPECTPPETWSVMENKCRIFPWWQVMR
ncbi:MAG: hypothetical protein ACRD4W_00635 [Nitrososphaeraceae archaeon]